MANKIDVKNSTRLQKTWDVVLDGAIFEGGFFEKEAAEKAADELRADLLEETRHIDEMKKFFFHGAPLFVQK